MKEFIARKLCLAGLVVLAGYVTIGHADELQNSNPDATGSAPATGDKGISSTAGDDNGTENWNAKFQSTYIWQTHPSFPAKYTGPNSLLPVHEKEYTWTATAALGFRPWPGGEFYFDPEMSEATTFSGLHGLGGMTNGENQKGSSTTPMFYTARAFLRQTWGFGGGKEHNDSDMNRLAGSVDKNRLVLTAGRLSVIDVFDRNSYASDPRTQFMNWSFLTYGAFDYAADTKGYSDGVALEYYHGDWAARIGRFAQPKASNGPFLDYRMDKHYGDEVEIEHDHEILGHPGKIRLLGFHNYANMGNFNDALAFAQTNGGTPDVANVRRDQSKYGGGISFEQSFGKDLGVFGRAGWNNGQTETYAFTEIERSSRGLPGSVRMTLLVSLSPAMDCRRHTGPILQPVGWAPSWGMARSITGRRISSKPITASA